VATLICVKINNDPKGLTMSGMTTVKVDVVAFRPRTRSRVRFIYVAYWNVLAEQERTEAAIASQIKREYGPLWEVETWGLAAGS
jgi:hypothetical protein